MKRADSATRNDPGSTPSWLGYTIGPAFFALAAWFMWGPNLADVPQTQAAHVDAAALTTGPRRTALTDPPTIHINGFDRTCMDCHRMFPPRDDTPKQLLQHSHIKLDHGINDRCRNCHDTDDRNRLVLYGGESIPYARVVELCEKCHGPTYKAWKRGAHGRTNGYWDASRGAVRRLICTECHDPHNPRVPAMDSLQPLPPPDTLRMGKPHPEADEATPDEHDPLRLTPISDEPDENATHEAEDAQP